MTPTVLVYDTDVSRALQEASLIDENALRGAALTEATAYLAFASLETGGAPLLVALDRDGVTARESVSAARSRPRPRLLASPR